MSNSIELTYKGLTIEAEIEDYDPGVHTYSNGDPGYPPSGGGCESFFWVVNDLDEVLLAMGISDDKSLMIRTYYKMFGELPRTLCEKIDREWEKDIMDAATDYFWNDA